MNIKIVGFWGAYPAGAGATSSYVLEKDGFRCLIDCGSGTLSRLQPSLNPSDIDAIVLSHYHHDHVADIGPFQYAILVHNKIHQTNKVLPIFGHDKDQKGFQSLTHHYTKGISYTSDSSLSVGPFRFTFIKTNHPVPCYAMRITDGSHSIVYTADTSYMDELIPFSKDADLLITDCSFYEGQDGSGPGHMNSKECGELAEKARVKNLWLSHLPHFGDVNQLVNQASSYYSGQVTLAYEGLSWNS